MHKTPDEIKKGLECCASIANCADGCPYHVIVEGSFGCEEMGCEDGLLPDALAYIQQIEEKYKHAMENAKILSDAVTKLERERDFLIKYLTDSTFTPCDICKHGVEGESVIDCERTRKVGFPCFEWRGLPKV